ncbi:MAG TPA: prolyl oligopeptidase family serine peptidase [bacterium]|nr:prolyl oligopeptidase family serine peptidase [bacterium]HPP11452.1 prolyl oligopeptidase family serine peptidase [bacterium]
MKEILVRSSLDRAEEVCLFWPVRTGQPAPLLVGLHTWSTDRYNLVTTLLPLAKRRRWHLLLPEFRGPNLSSNNRCRQACGSRLARQDVIDAVEKVCSLVSVNRGKIFLFGGSGGGHMALLLAGYRPELWASVASFCGITDLTAWHGENPHYAPHIEACCGGPPGKARLKEYRERSPLFHAASIARAKEVYIYHGKFDRSVPFTHGLRLYQKICRIDPEAKVFLNIFDGGHEILLEQAEKQFLQAGAKKIQSSG